MDPITHIVPVRYTLSRERFTILQPLTLTFIPNIPEEAGAFRVSFTPPGCHDIQQLEGKLEKLRATAMAPTGAFVPVWAYCINQQVFLISQEDADHWIEEQFHLNGAIDDFTQLTGTPCWLSLKAFWMTTVLLDSSPVELELVSFFGTYRLRHALNGRAIEMTDIIKH